MEGPFATRPGLENKNALVPITGQKRLLLRCHPDRRSCERPFATRTIIRVPMDNGWVPVGIYCGQELSGSSRPQKSIRRPPRAPFSPSGALFGLARAGYCSSSQVCLLFCCVAIIGPRRRFVKCVLSRSVMEGSGRDLWRSCRGGGLGPFRAVIPAAGSSPSRSRSGPARRTSVRPRCGRSRPVPGALSARSAARAPSWAAPS